MDPYAQPRAVSELQLSAVISSANCESEEGPVLLVELYNPGEPRVIPAWTCEHVPWASALHFKFRKGAEIRELPARFVDPRYRHRHGPFTIDQGETLEQAIWLHDYIVEVGWLTRDKLEVCSELRAQGPPVVDLGELELPSRYKLWNGELCSNWVPLAG